MPKLTISRLIGVEGKTKAKNGKERRNLSIGNPYVHKLDFRFRKKAPVIKPRHEKAHENLPHTF